MKRRHRAPPIVSRIVRLAQRAALRRLDSNPPTPSGPTPTGDQGLSAPLALAASGAAPAWRVGLDYPQTGSWSTPSTSRLYAHGGVYLARAAATITFQVYVRGGTNSGQFRAAIYGDNGLASLDTDTPVANGQRPLTLLGYSSAVTIVGNQAENYVAVTITPSTPIPAGSVIYPTLITDTSTSSYQFKNLVSGGPASSSGRWNTNSGIYTWNATAAPPSTFPSSGSTTQFDNAEWLVLLDCTPPAPAAPSVLTAVAEQTRSVLLSWSAVAGIERYAVERRPAGGSWANVIEVAATTHRDTDLASGTTYEYRVKALDANVASSPSATASATVLGVRQAYASVTPTLLASAPDSPGRGLHGRSVTISGVEQFVGYKRTSFDLRTLHPDPTTWNVSGIINWLDALPAGCVGHIRMRVYVPGGGNLLPDYISTNPAKAYVSGSDTWPIWNAIIPDLLEAIPEIAQRIRTHPKLAELDVGWIGPFGEWTGAMGVLADYRTATGNPSATNADMHASQANLQAIIAAMVTNFPDQMLCMSLWRTADVTYHTNVLRYAYEQGIRNFRQDALGETNEYEAGQFYVSRSAYLRYVLSDDFTMRTAEDYLANMVEAQWVQTLYEIQQIRIGTRGDANLSQFNAQTATAQQAIRDGIAAAGYRFDVVGAHLPTVLVIDEPFYPIVGWANTGNNTIHAKTAIAPVWELRDTGSSALVWSSASTFDLRSLRPNAKTVGHQDAITVSTESGVAPGSYALGLRVPGYRSSTDIRLGITGKTAANFYPLATVEVQN